MSDRLNEWMRRVAEDVSVEAPARIEAAVLAEFDRVKRRRRIASWSIKAGALAAGMALAFWIPTREELKPVPVADSEQPYIAIPYVTQLAPYERAEVVRMRLPVAALVAAGLPVRNVDPGADVEADVLVGQDGRARALRLVSMN
jgi:hypothetical protein